MAILNGVMPSWRPVANLVALWFAFWYSALFWPSRPVRRFPPVIMLFSILEIVFC